MLRFATLSLLLALSGGVSGAATLSSGSSTATVTDTGIITVWRLEPGQPDNIFLSELFIRREGETADRSLDAALGGGVLDQSAPDRLAIAYEADGLRAEVRYGLTGGPAGSNRSTLTREATLTNTGADPLSFTLFDYSDFDIRFDQLNQRDRSILTAPGVIETRSATAPLRILTRVTPEPDQHQISDFFTLYSAFFLDSDGATTLTNAPAAGTSFSAPPGDTALAFGWELSLAPGESATIGHRSALAPIPLPAPAALLLAGLGALAFLRRGRASRN